MYKHIWSDKQRGGQLFQHLRRKGNVYQARSKDKQAGRGFIKNRISIDERPCVVDDRSRIGGLKMAIIGRIPGSVIGAVLLLYVSVTTLSLWLGIFVLLSLAVSFSPFRVGPTPVRLTIAGFLSGFMGTSSGIGGPPIALLLQHQEGSKLRGNLSAFFYLALLFH